MSKKIYKNCCFLLFCCLPMIASAEDLYPFVAPTQATQFHRLLKELRCLVCQNQDLSDSNALLANDLRFQVYRLIKENHTDNEIKHYLSSRYGDFILFKPPVKLLTILLWSGPLLFLSIGLLIFWRINRPKPIENQSC